MRVDLKKLQGRAEGIFDRERLGEGDYRVVAFVLDSRGHVLSEGWNSYTKSHPIQRSAALEHQDRHKQFLHAEIHALSRIRRKQLGRQSAIVVYRLGATKELRPGKPCKICQSVIEQYGIDQIIHS